MIIGCCDVFHGGSGLLWVVGGRFWCWWVVARFSKPRIYLNN